MCLDIISFSFEENCDYCPVPSSYAKTFVWILITEMRDSTRVWRGLKEISV